MPSGAGALLVGRGAGRRAGAVRPVRAGDVPRARCRRRSRCIGFDLGERDVTTAESDAYVQAVDARPAAGDRRHARAHGQGRPLRYAIVGQARTASPTAGLARIRLGRPADGPADTTARSGRASRPGTRRSCGSPATSTAARRAAPTRRCGSCASSPTGATAPRSQILDDAIVVILPTQNPDGREADTRRNAYGFDMNRDWFARTQPETDGKLELLRRYPPVLFIDAHEMGGTTASSSRRTPTRSTTRSPTSRSAGSTTSTAAARAASSTRAGSRTSTTTSTTCSTWATATRCPRPGSARRA